MLMHRRSSKELKATTPRLSLRLHEGTRLVTVAVEERKSVSIKSQVNSCAERLLKRNMPFFEFKGTYAILHPLRSFAQQ